MSNFALTLLVILVCVAAVIWLYSVFFKRSTKEIAFVRTGFGGQKVVLGGGAFVIPVFHEAMPVRLTTQRLRVERNREQSLLTHDKMRVDMEIDFYIRVAAEVDAVSLAAQALGRKSLDAEALKDLLEGKFVDAMRSVAATMNMEALHKDRGGFIRDVSELLGEELGKNGLQLESTSLSGFNQTSMEFFDPSNAFDAEGLTRLTEEIEARKKDRNDIEQDSLVKIRSKNLETEKTQLLIERESETARLTQQHELEARRAATQAEISKDKAEQMRAAQIAEITAKQEVERARIEQERLISEQEVTRQLALDLAEQERVIRTAQESIKETAAKTAADQARAGAIAAEESIYTARETAQAERKQAIDLILTSLEVEKRKLRDLSGVETEQRIAELRVQTDKLEAKSFAETAAIRSEGDAKRHAVAAEAARLMAEAENTASDATRAGRLRLRLLDRLEGIIRESARPMEKIGDVRIMDLGTAAPHINASGEPAPGLSDRLVTSALRYRAQAPLVDQLLAEIGVKDADLSNLSHLADEKPGED